MNTIERQRLKENGLLRQRRIVQGPQGTTITINNKQYLSFCSNDYLGLANHPQLAAAATQAIATSGIGSGASHLITGHNEWHHRLEEELAQFLGRSRVLLFSTGYMANLGVVSALTDRHSTLYADRLNHASLIDAATLARAKCLRYQHGDMQQLAQLLRKNSGQQDFIISDGVFSMDGDLAPLDQLAQLARQHQACLMIDDAHGIGVLGENGKGCAEHFGLDEHDLPLLVGTLGKAFGSFGAFVAGSADHIETLIQKSRSYIYTTALPPAIAAASLASLHLILSEQWRRDALFENIAYFKSAAQRLELNLLPSSTPIQALIIGEPQHALKLSAQLEEQGILVSAIRPPTVPEGSSRLRITLSATHNKDDIDTLMKALQRYLPSTK